LLCLFVYMCVSVCLCVPVRVWRTSGVFSSFLWEQDIDKVSVSLRTRTLTKPQTEQPWCTCIIMTAGSTEEARMLCCAVLCCKEYASKSNRVLCSRRESNATVQGTHLHVKRAFQCSFQAQTAGSWLFFRSWAEKQDH